MKTKFGLCVLIVGFLVLLSGCDDGDDNDALTVANLSGTYDLDISGSMLGDLVDDNVDVMSGVLEIDTTSVTFDVVGVATQSFVIADADRLTVTADDGTMMDVQATLTDAGATLTFVDLTNGNTLVFVRQGMGGGTDLTLDNLQGMYDLDVARSSPLDLGNDDFGITSAVLGVTGSLIRFIATGTFQATYEITNRATVTVTEADGDVVEVQVTLSNDSTRLRVVVDDGDIYLLDKR